MVTFRFIGKDGKEGSLTTFLPLPYKSLVIKNVSVCLSSCNIQGVSYIRVCVCVCSSKHNLIL